MELKALRYFVAIVNERSISSAAESLRVSQPTLSRQIDSLESETGARLLSRSRRAKRVSATESGERLYEYASEIIELLDKAEAGLSEGDDEAAGEVFVGVAQTLGAASVIKTAARAMRENPSLRVNFLRGPERSLMSRLDRQLLDFCVVAEDVDREKYFACDLREQSEWGLLARSDDAIAPKRSVSPRDIKPLRLLLPSDALKTGEISRWAGAPYERLKIAGIYNSCPDAAEMVEERAGLALCRRSQAAGLGDGLLFKPLSPKLLAHAKVVWRKSLPLLKSAETFALALKADAQARAKTTERPNG